MLLHVNFQNIYSAWKIWHDRNYNYNINKIIKQIMAKVHWGDNSYSVEINIRELCYNLITVFKREW